MLAMFEAIQLCIQWDLVCDNLGLYSSTIAAAQVGMFFGSLGFGYILDR